VSKNKIFGCNDKFLVKIKKNEVDKIVYPVLTISTNSDIKRHLNINSDNIL